MQKVSTEAGGAAGARARRRRGWFAGLAGAGRRRARGPRGRRRRAAGPRPGGRRGAAVYRAETSVVLPPQVNPFGQPEVDVRAFVLVRGGEAVLVDALTPGNAGLIGAALAAAGLGWDALRHVLLTHAHPDHAGSAADVLALAPGATAWIARRRRTWWPCRARPARWRTATRWPGCGSWPRRGTAPGTCACSTPPGDGGARRRRPQRRRGARPDRAALHPGPARAAASLARLAALGFERALFAHGPALESGAAAALAAVGAGGG